MRARRPTCSRRRKACARSGVRHRRSLSSRTPCASVKAIVMREFGAPEVMRLEDVATPEPGPGEVLIRVKAVSVNRTLDLIVRSGKYATPVKLPHVLGVDPSGVVEALGPEVTARQVGERVVT